MVHFVHLLCRVRATCSAYYHFNLATLPTMSPSFVCCLIFPYKNFFSSTLGNLYHNWDSTLIVNFQFNFGTFLSIRIPFVISLTLCIFCFLTRFSEQDILFYCFECFGLERDSQFLLVVVITFFFLLLFILNAILFERLLNS